MERTTGRRTTRATVLWGVICASLALCAEQAVRAQAPHPAHSGAVAATPWWQAGIKRALRTDAPLLALSRAALLESWQHLPPSRRPAELQTAAEVERAYWELYLQRALLVQKYRSYNQARQLAGAEPRPDALDNWLAALAASIAEQEGNVMRAEARLRPLVDEAGEWEIAPWDTPPAAVAGANPPALFEPQWQLDECRRRWVGHQLDFQYVRSADDHLAVQQAMLAAESRLAHAEASFGLAVGRVSAEHGIDTLFDAAPTAWPVDVRQQAPAALHAAAAPTARRPPPATIDADTARLWLSDGTPLQINTRGPAIVERVVPADEPDRGRGWR